MGSMLKACTEITPAPTVAVRVLSRSACAFRLASAVSSQRALAVKIASTRSTGSVCSPTQSAQSDGHRASRLEVGRCVGVASA